MAECEKVVQVHRPAAPACVGRRAEAHAPARQPRVVRRAARAASATRVPGVTLRTTFIVGFPGETDDDFDELERFVSETRFDHVGVFTYSHEEGTRAFAFPDDVPASVKRRRRNALMAQQKQIVARLQKARIGTDVDVMIDGPSPEHELVLQGRLEGQAPDIDPVVFLTDCDAEAYSAGQLIRARIVEAKGYDLIAKPTVELANR